MKIEVYTFEWVIEIKVFLIIGMRVNSSIKCNRSHHTST